MLPVALLVLVILSMITVTGMVTSRSDHRAAQATRQAAVALAAADAGASRTVALWAQEVPTLPAPGDSVVVDWQELPDGSRYRSVVQRAPVGAGEPAPKRVLMVTTGLVRPPGTARRTIATIVEVAGGGSLCCTSGLQVQTAVRVIGDRRVVPNSGVDGTDRIPPGWSAAECPGGTQDLPGIVTSDAAMVEVRSGGEVLGTPPLLEDTALSVADFDDFGSTTWTELTAGADVVLSGNQRLRDEVGPVVAGGSCATTVPSNWGSPLDPGGPCGAHRPVVYVAGNLVLQGSGAGQGVLLVEGDLQIDGDFVYYGLVIVRGRMRFTAPGRVYGAVLVRGGPAGTMRSDLTEGARIAYSSCAVHNALDGIPGGSGTAASAAVERSWFEVVR